MISCKQISPLIVLSINTPNPTRDLDALSEGEGDQAHAAGPCNDEVPVQHQQPQQHVCDNLRVNQQHLGEA